MKLTHIILFFLLLLSFDAVAQRDSTKRFFLRIDAGMSKTNNSLEAPKYLSPKDFPDAFFQASISAGAQFPNRFSTFVEWRNYRTDYYFKGIKTPTHLPYTIYADEYKRISFQALTINCGFAVIKNQKFEFVTRLGIGGLFAVRSYLEDFVTDSVSKTRLSANGSYNFQIGIEPRFHWKKNWTTGVSLLYALSGYRIKNEDVVPYSPEYSTYYYRHTNLCIFLSYSL